MNANETLSNETLANATEYGPWRSNCNADWWSILMTSSVLTLHSIIWLLSTFGGIGTIKDLLCDLACATACDGWKNVDYVTEMAKFFSYWTFMPFIIMTYAGISTIDGVLGICGTVLEHKPTMKATMIIGVIYLILAFVLLIFFSVVSCLYWVCRCCIEKTVDEAKELAETLEQSNLNEHSKRADAEANNDGEEEEEGHSYCWNFFSHFAIPIFVYIVLYCVLLARGWKFAFGDNTCA